MKEIVRPMSEEEAVEALTKFLEENPNLLLCDEAVENAAVKLDLKEEIPFVKNLPPDTPPRVYIV